MEFIATRWQKLEAQQMQEQKLTPYHHYNRSLPVFKRIVIVKKVTMGALREGQETSIDGLGNVKLRPQIH